MAINFLVGAGRLISFSRRGDQFLSPGREVNFFLTTKDFILKAARSISFPRQEGQFPSGGMEVNFLSFFLAVGRSISHSRRGDQFLSTAKIISFSREDQLLSRGGDQVLSRGGVDFFLAAGINFFLGQRPSGRAISFPEAGKSGRKINFFPRAGRGRQGGGGQEDQFLIQGRKRHSVLDRWINFFLQAARSISFPRQRRATAPNGERITLVGDCSV